MERLARLQLIGPLALFGAMGVAEAATLGLVYWPSSSLLWYLNLEVFSVFRKSRLIIDDVCGLAFAQLLVVAGPLALLTCLGIALRRNVMIAAASNLGFVYAVFLVYSWHHWHASGIVRSASLTWVQMPPTSHLYMFSVLMCACFVSFVATHLIYLRAARAA